mmetsp:Transcript_2125/g.3264  ORF Transcript_2125/g.3264 Transcript_2125/m.3264 type:complete len:110 (+) Transcript_2125:318-647(+)
MVRVSTVTRRDRSAPLACGQRRVKNRPGPSDFTTLSGFSLNVNGMKREEKLEQICYQLADSTANFSAFRKLGLREISIQPLRHPPSTPPDAFFSTMAKTTSLATVAQEE